MKHRAVIGFPCWSPVFYRTLLTMFERVNSNPWKRVNLVDRAEEYGTRNLETPVRGATDSPEREKYETYIKNLRTKGKFYTPLLEPGDVYEVRIFDDTLAGFDPNIHGADQYLKALDVFALCSKPAEDVLFGQHGLEMGGTYCFVNVSALKPVFMKGWIGETPPVVRPDGTQEILSSTVSTSLPNLAPNHEYEFQPLLPGTPYHILLRLSDKKGRWQFIALTGTTKQRTAMISFKTIHMIDDSDYTSAGNAFYQFQIKESGRVTFYERFPDLEELKLGSGTPPYNLPPRLSQSLGPKRILPGEEEISVAVHGYDVDRSIPRIPFVDIDLGTSHEEASSGTFGSDEFEPLRIPTGRFMEKTAIDSETILEAKPDDRDGGGELRFDVKVAYSITYV